MILTLYLSLKLMCTDVQCYPVAVGPDTYRSVGVYPLTAYSVPDNKTSKYGPVWYQIDSDDDWGIHAYPNFGTWMSSHGCIRMHINDIISLNESPNVPSALVIRK